MRYLKNTLALIFLFVLTSSCKKSDSGTNNDTAPTNLMVSADISNDGTGNVIFTATATNANNYDFEFGDGVVKSEASGIITYKYTQLGSVTYNVTVTAKNASSATIKKTIQVTVNYTGAVTLVWFDEFNTDGAPDVNKWGYDLGSGGWGNNELQYYTNRSENAVVQGGVLKIKAIKESYGGSAYTSARLLSKNKYAFTYGKVEVRAKLPAGGGTWPAIWMLGSDINTVSWPACGEIDIMEHVGNQLNKIYGTLHYPGRFGGSANGNTIMISNATTEFHIYSLEWTASTIKISVDNQVYHSVANSSSIPFNHDFFFILNIAMGGGLGGAVDPAFTNATMEVDYIRVYK